MNAAEIRACVLRTLSSIAPEMDATNIDERQPLRDCLDLDSMDFLNLLIALGRELHVEIPERDYAKLQTLGGMVDYLASQLAAAR